MLATLMVCAVGCFGVSQNPSYFPHLVPFGDIIQTHAKPPGHSYYANFDPQAVRLEVEPKEMVSQVGSQVALLSTVYDAENKPRRNRRIEWMTEGVGSIVEVDESGVFPGRGYKTSNKHAVSYTSWGEHRMARGNGNPQDDFMVRPGQSWCVISSPIEGDTHVTVYAPGIHDWQKRAVHRVVRWVDVSWEFPAPAVARFGTEHMLSTKVMRFTDRRPLKGYIVRYRLIDGPAARFLPSNTQQIDVESNLSGEAKATLVQNSPASGINRIAVEIVRPPDVSTAAGAGTTIATGETTVEWLAPNVILTHQAPPPTAINQEMIFNTAMQNTGRIESRSMTLICPIPDGLEYVRSNPPAVKDGNQLVWTFGSLAVGQQHAIQTVYRGLRAGPVKSVAMLTTEEGQRDQKEANTDITTPGLKVKIAAPPTATVGAPVSYQLSVTNTGSGPLDKIALTAEFERGLEHAQKAQVLTLSVDGLAPGQSRNEILVLTPIQPGRWTTKVTGNASGLTDVDLHSLTVIEPKLAVKIIDAPQERVVGRPADFKIQVTNQGEAPITGLIVRARLPQEVNFKGASANGQFQNGDVVWNLGTLPAQGNQVLDVSTEAQRPAGAAVFAVIANAEGNINKSDQVVFAIKGVAALGLLVTDEGYDPTEVGKKVVYRIEVKNTGSAPNNNVVLRAKIPPEFRFLRAAGASKETVNPDGSLVFAKIDNLAGGAKLDFAIEVEAIKAGQVIFEASVTSDATPTPVPWQEPTRILPVVGGNPGLVPNGGVPPLPNVPAPNPPGGANVPPAISPVPMLPMSPPTTNIPPPLQPLPPG